MWDAQTVQEETPLRVHGPQSNPARLRFREGCRIEGQIERARSTGLMVTGTSGWIGPLDMVSGDGDVVLYRSPLWGQ